MTIPIAAARISAVPISAVTIPLVPMSLVPIATAPITTVPITTVPIFPVQSEWESEVTAALVLAPDVDSEKLTISADHGVVTLSGDADHPGDRSAPQAVAHQVPGVAAVRNELAVLHARSEAAVPPSNGATSS